MLAKNFRELEVYKLARGLSLEIFEISKSFPKAETFSLTDLLRRALRSIGAQIAEAWGKRRYQKHFISKQTDADGEQHETQHWIEPAFDCGYITESQRKTLADRCSSINRMLNSMIKKANHFCFPNNHH